MMSTSLPEHSSSPPRLPRSPLSTSSNGASRPLTPSPTYVASKSIPPLRIIRRKPSLRALHLPHLDSSESFPSAHSSLYDASLQNFGLDDAAAVSRTWDVSPSAVTVPTSPARSNSSRSTSWNQNDENTPSPQNSRTDRGFSSPPRNNTLHTPHVLAPITERPSNTTLRPSNSTRRKASLSLPTPLTAVVTPLRRAPLPFPIPPRSPHRPFLSLEQLAALADEPVPVPHLPPLPPPARIPTPPGLPTFNSPAAVSYRLQAPPLRRRDRFRPATPKMREWRAQTSRLPRGVVMRGDDGVLVRGRFRWGGGGDVAHVSRHPWNQQSDADADGTAGYVDRLRRSTAQGQQSDVATVAGRFGWRSVSRNGQERNATAQGMRSGGTRDGKGGGSIWDRVWERGCWVCCGAEEGEEEEGAGNLGNVVVMDVVGPEGTGGVEARGR